MDSQLPNKAAAEWIRAGGLFPEQVQVYAEKTYGNSRFDLYIESEKRKAFIEVKGVTLEEDGVALFPDAPTERGVKHVSELIRAHESGFEAYILFVIQMKGVRLFLPNAKMHPDFANALVQAKLKGVNILAMDCVVTENSIEIDLPVPIKLTE
jgi:sugar fermentation stimulation protein A